MSFKIVLVREVEEMILERSFKMGQLKISVKVFAGLWYPAKNTKIIVRKIINLVLQFIYN